MAETYGEFTDFRPTADFVGAFLPEPPARVLEIGCGDGELATSMHERGNSVVAIDPKAPEGPNFRAVTLEEFAEPGPFASVVAVRALHHIPDLPAALEKIAALLAPGGALILEDFGWERMDDRTLAWFFDRMRALGHGPRDHPVPGSLDECRQAWTEEHEGLHMAPAMLQALGARFTTRMFAWTDFLCRLLNDPDGKPAEIEALIVEAIQPLGFRYVGLRD